jgi:hypothetical protein
VPATADATDASEREDAHIVQQPVLKEGVMWEPPSGKPRTASDAERAAMTAALTKRLMVNSSGGGLSRPL